MPPILPGGQSGSDSGQWWIVISAGSDKATVIQSQAKPTGYATVLGPFATQEDADKLAGIKPGTIQKSATGGNLLSGIDSLGATFEAAYDDITDGKLWRSLGWIVLGILLVIAGLYLWVRTSKAYASAQSAIEGLV